MAQKSKYTKEEFISEIKRIHGDNFTFENVVYKNMGIDIDIACIKHGSRLMRPSNLLKGGICRLCMFEQQALRQKDTIENFINKATKKHGDRYSYSSSIYGKNSSEKMTISCPDHGDFEMSPNSHLQGQGCRYCTKTGYSPANSGTLYIMTAGDFTKVGITKVSPTLRANRISKSAGEEFTVYFTEFFRNGRIPLDIETAILKELKQKYKQPKRSFDGSTETFVSVDRKWLVTRITELIHQQAK